MNYRNYYGIDLGTTHWRFFQLNASDKSQAPQPLSLTICDPARHCLSAALLIDEGSKILACGERAYEEITHHDSSISVNLLDAFKLCLGNNQTVVASEPNRRYTHQKALSYTGKLLSKVLERLQEEKPNCLATNNQFIFTHPVHWGKTKSNGEIEGEILNDFVVTIRDCFPERLQDNIHFVAEPEAALISLVQTKQLQELATGYTLIVDIGGGTTDLVAGQWTAESLQDIRYFGAAYGGNHFDQVIADSIAQRLNLDESQQFSLDRQLRYYGRKFKENLSQQARINSSQPVNLTVLLASPTNVLRQAISLTCAEFEQIATEGKYYLQHSLLASLEKMQLAPENIGQIILVGGGARLFIIPNILREMFGDSVPIIYGDPPESTVARGAALWGVRYLTIGFQNLLSGANSKRLQNLLIKEERTVSYKTEVKGFINNLARVNQARHEFAGYLGRTASIIQQAELEGDKTSGQLGITRDIEDLNLASKNLDRGVFRLMVLGDMKRGKSTLLNVLLGKKLLPSAVNPCTALLTILRFGHQEKVTVYFKNGKKAEQLTFESFTRQYTIDPKEAKRLEAEKTQAFPDVDYAVVEYPLPLLENGVEIVDSPGLNDTEDRNELTLGYVNNCHAILFVLSATQPCTKEERRYLENYIKGRGLTVFFLINRWDELRSQVFDPNDPNEVREAEEQQRQVFESNLHEYCLVDGSDLYDERVFEISAQNALRQRIQNLPLDGTGLPEFMGALNTFLTQERAVSEFRQAKTLVRQTYKHIHDTVERRIPLLGQSVGELKQRIESVEPEFRKLNDILHQFKDEIITMRDRRASSVASSLRSHIANLDQTFESDFKPYQPELKFFDFLRKGKRQEFARALEQGFKQYINDKISAWSLTAERDIKEAFLQLAVSASEYGSSYSRVTDRITAKLTGQNLSLSESANPEDRSPGWAKWAAGITTLLMGDFVGLGMAGAGVFNWKSILGNLAAIVGVNAALYAAFNVFLGPVGIVLTGLGVGLAQGELARRTLVKTMKEQMKKQLPEVARQQSVAIEGEVKKLFDDYREEVCQRISEDIASRQDELQKLVQQKESHEINREAEIARLRHLESDVYSQWQQLETAYDQLTGQKG